MINDTIDPFINAYRDSLQRQRDMAMQNLENTRRNNMTTLMSEANRAGALYSNFPMRDKVKYDTETYQPSMAKIQNTYQTGLDTLRANTVNLANQLASVNEAIAELNEA